MIDREGVVGDYGEQGYEGDEDSGVLAGEEEHLAFWRDAKARALKRRRRGQLISKTGVGGEGGGRRQEKAGRLENGGQGAGGLPSPTNAIRRVPDARCSALARACARRHASARVYTRPRGQVAARR